MSNFHSDVTSCNCCVSFRGIREGISSVGIRLGVLGSLVNSRSVRGSFRGLVSGCPRMLGYVPLLLTIHTGRVCTVSKSNTFACGFGGRGLPIRRCGTFVRGAKLFGLVSGRLMGGLISCMANIRAKLSSGKHGGHNKRLVRSLIRDFVDGTNFVGSRACFGRVCVRRVARG